jgi:hypothetical protein
MVSFFELGMEGHVWMKISRLLKWYRFEKILKGVVSGQSDCWSSGAVNALRRRTRLMER